MLDAPDVLVHGHPVLGGGALEHPLIVVRRAVAEEIPGRLHEGVHGVGVAPRLAPAARARGVDEGRHAREWRPALAADLDVLGQHHGQVLFALGHHAALLAVENGNGRAPVALPADAPVAEPVVDLRAPDPLPHEPVDGRALGLVHGQPVEEARVDLHAVARVGLGVLPSFRTLDGGDDVEPVLLGELPVPLVFSRHGHDGTRAVAHEDIVGEEERDLRVRERIDGARAEPQPTLRPVGGEALDLGLPRHLLPKGGHTRALLLVGDEGVHEGVLGGEHRVGHAEGGVGPRGEDRDGEAGASHHGQVELRALTPSDPVALHGEDPLGPAGEPVAPVQALLGIVGDLEEPAFDLLGLDLGIAAPAAARLHLLVGEDGLARRTPVDLGALLVGETPLEHPDEDELLPPVVRGIAGGELAVPIVGHAETPELRLHVGDVLEGPHGGMDPVVDGGILRGEAEGVPSHGVEDVEAPHELEAGQKITDGVDADVAHVNPARGIGKHLEAVVLGPARILGDPELLALLPDPLPLGLDVPEGITVLAVVDGHISG